MVIKAFCLVKHRQFGSKTEANEGEDNISRPTLILDRMGDLAVLTIDRADAGNRIDAGVAAEFRDRCADLRYDDTLRVVILTGNGPVFSVGRDAPASQTRVAELQAASAVASLPVPVVVALNGDATDHGLELALAGDLRVTDGGAKFGFSPPSAGSFPFDGGTQRLLRLVGPGWARDMLLTGRLVSSSEALSIGLVNRVAGPEENALQMAVNLAGEIRKGSPLGARYSKEAVSQGSDMTLGQALGLEADLNVILQSTADRAEGLSSFLQRRKPGFTGE